MSRVQTKSPVFASSAKRLTVMGRSSAPGVPWTRLDEGKDAFDSLAVRKALIAPADANNRTAETMIYLTLMVDPR